MNSRLKLINISFTYLHCFCHCSCRNLVSIYQYGKHTICNLLNHFYIYFLYYYIYFYVIVFFTISYCSYLSMHAVKKLFLALETFLFENWTLKKTIFSQGPVDSLRFSPTTMQVYSTTLHFKMSRDTPSSISSYLVAPCEHCECSFATGWSFYHVYIFYKFCYSIIN